MTIRRLEGCDALLPHGCRGVHDRPPTTLARLVHVRVLTTRAAELGVADHVVEDISTAPGLRDATDWSTMEVDRVFDVDQIKFGQILYLPTSRTSILC